MKNRHIIYREIKIRMIADFLLEKVKVRREWSNIFKVLTEKRTVI